MILYNLFILYNYSLNRKSVDTRYIEDRISWSICILYNLRNWLRNLHVSFISRNPITETHISTQLWMHQLHENDPICWSSTCVHSIIPLSRSYLSKMLAGFRVHKHWLNKFMQFQFCKIKSTLSSLSLCRFQRYRKDLQVSLRLINSTIRPKCKQFAFLSQVDRSIVKIPNSPSEDPRRTDCICLNVVSVLQTHTHIHIHIYPSPSVAHPTSTIIMQNYTIPVAHLCLYHHSNVHPPQRSSIAYEILELKQRTKRENVCFSAHIAYVIRLQHIRWHMWICE